MPPGAQQQQQCTRLILYVTHHGHIVEQGENLLGVAQLFGGVNVIRAVVLGSQRGCGTGLYSRGGSGSAPIALELMTMLTDATTTAIDAMTFRVLVLKVQRSTVSRSSSRVLRVSYWIVTGDGARGGGLGSEELADTRALEEIPKARREQPRTVRDRDVSLVRRGPFHIRWRGRRLGEGDGSSGARHDVRDVMLMGRRRRRGGVGRRARRRGGTRGGRAGVVATTRGAGAARHFLRWHRHTDFVHGGLLSLLMEVLVSVTCVVSGSETYRAVPRGGSYPRQRRRRRRVHAHGHSRGRSYDSC